MKLLKGQKIAQTILENLKKEIEASGLRLRLAVVLVGENSVSRVFIRQKEKIADSLGIDFKLFHFSEDVSFSNLKKEIQEICVDPENSGVVIQLPLPPALRKNDQEILNIIPSEKDPDILSENNLGKFYSDTLRALPPVVAAISYLFDNYNINPEEKNVLLVGTGRLVGFPLAVWLLKKEATVSAINKFTKDISFFTQKADIIISGVGKPGLIKGDMIKEGAVIIDAGASSEKGKTLGDVDIKSVEEKAGCLSPVPGGVGPLTVACLFENLVKLCHKK